MISQIELNYNTSYTYKLNIESTKYYFNINYNNISIEETSGIVHILAGLDIGQYNIIVYYLIDDQEYSTNIELIIKPIITYNLALINSNCNLMPILSPNINQGIFSILEKIDNIVINSQNGMISCNNLLVGIYSFNVVWEINSIKTSYYCHFIIKPQFYYLNDTSSINHGKEFISEPVIINPNNSYILSSPYNINEQGSIRLKNLDVGYYQIPIYLKIDSIQLKTIYHLTVKPIVKYLDYVCSAFSNYQITNPYVSELGGQFSLMNDQSIVNEHFIIDKLGNIIVNSPSGMYTINVIYNKRNAETITPVNIIVNPIVTYNDETINCNDQGWTSKPITNELIDEYFILSHNNFIINDLGQIYYYNLEPNNYKIIIKCKKNNCEQITELNLIVKPVLEILTGTQIIEYGQLMNNINYIIYPINSIYSLSGPDNILINENNFIINENKVGNYNIDLVLTMNDITTITNYNFIILPSFEYLNDIYYINYNELFISDKPIINIESNYIINIESNYSFTINVGQINNQGQIEILEILDVGVHELIIELNYNEYKIKRTLQLIVKPLIKINDQKFIYSEIINVESIVLPINGILKLDDNMVQPLNVGIYDFIASYTYNGIESFYNYTIEIIKKEIKLKFKDSIKEYDGTTNIELITENNINLTGSFTNPNVGKNKLILFNYEDNNYYTKQKKIKGEIYKKTIIPNIKVTDKIYNGTNKANVELDCNPIKIISYTAYYIDCNVGNQRIIINNIEIEPNQNYQLSSDIYEVLGNILPRDINMIYVAEDKIYDGTTECKLKLAEIQNIAPKDKYKILNGIKQVSYSNSGIGENEIIIKETNELSNYKITIPKIIGNIKAQVITLNMSVYNKIYDGNDIATINFNTDLKILSYEANYNNKNVNYNKKVYIKNIILENKNYIVEDCIIYGNILPFPLEINFYGQDKIYDGTNKIESYYILNDTNDDLKCLYELEFKTINCGINLDLIVKNIRLIGSDSKNYKISLVKTNNPSIYQKELEIVFKSIDKQYDGTTDAYIKVDTISGIIEKELTDVNIVKSNVYYSDTKVGLNKKIIVEDIILNPKLFNYYSNNTYCYGNILPRELQLVIDTPEKEFDGMPDANIIIKNIKNIIQDEQVYIKSLKSIFVNNSQVLVSDIILEGEDKNNYVCNDVKITGKIIPKELIIDFTCEDQEYDLNIEPIVTYKLLINDPGIQLLTYSAKYENIQVGIQNVIIDNIILNTPNYFVSKNIISGNILSKDKIISGNILSKDKIELKLKYLNVDKEYDGTNRTNLQLELDISNISISYFESEYKSNKVIDNNSIIIKNVKLLGEESDKYIVKDHEIEGQITKKSLKCVFKKIDNKIVGNLVGHILDDNINIINYISFKKNNDIFIQNITLDGIDKNNYNLINKTYKVE